MNVSVQKSNFCLFSRWVTHERKSILTLGAFPLPRERWCQWVKHDESSSKNARVPKRVAENSEMMSLNENHFHETLVSEPNPTQPAPISALIATKLRNSSLNRRTKGAAWTFGFLSHAAVYFDPSKIRATLRWSIKTHRAECWWCKAGGRMTTTSPMLLCNVPSNASVEGNF